MADLSGGPRPSGANPEPTEEPAERYELRDWLALVAEARSLVTNGELRAAWPKVQEAVTAVEQNTIELDVRRAFTYKLAATVAIGVARISLAEQYIDHARKIYVTLGGVDNPSLASLDRLSGEICLELQEYPTALESFQRVLDNQWSKENLSKAFFVDVTLNIARVHREMGAEDASEAAVLDAIEIARSNSEEAPELVAVLRFHAGKAMMAGLHRRAEILLEESISQLENAASEEAQIAYKPLYSALSQARFWKGDRGGAIAALQRGFEHERQRLNGDAERLFPLRRAQAELLELNGDPVGAEKLLRYDLEAMREVFKEDPAKLVPGLLDLASIAEDNMRVADAEGFIREVEEYLQDPISTEGARLLTQKAYLALMHQKPDEAEELLKEALITETRIPGLPVERPAVGHAHLRLGGLQIQLGKLDEAEQSLKFAEEILDSAFEVDVRRRTIGLNRLRGALKLARGEYAEGYEFLMRSLNEFQLSGGYSDTYVMVPTLIDLANYHFAVHSPGEAKGVLERAREILEAQGRGTHPTTIGVLGGLADWGIKSKLQSIGDALRAP